MELVEESEEISKEILGDSYIHFYDAMPEMKIFIAEVEAKEKLSPFRKLKEAEEKKDEKETGIFDSDEDED